MIWITGALLSVLPRPVAYLDPGSGSFLLQLLVAGLAALGIGLASQWKRIKQLFRKNHTQPDDVDDEDDRQEPNP